MPFSSPSPFHHFWLCFVLILFELVIPKVSSFSLSSNSIDSQIFKYCCTLTFVLSCSEPRFYIFHSLKLMIFFCFSLRCVCVCALSPALCVCVFIAEYRLLKISYLCVKHIFRWSSGQFAKLIIPFDKLWKLKFTSALATSNDEISISKGAATCPAGTFPRYIARHMQHTQPNGIDKCTYRSHIVHLHKCRIYCLRWTVPWSNSR